MNPFIVILIALLLAGVVIVLSILFGMKATDPKKVPLSSSMGVIEKKYHAVNGAARNVYPAVVLRDDDGTSRKLHLRNWAMYDELWEGDRVQVNHRDWWAEEILPLERGKNYEAAQLHHTTAATFRRAYVSNVSWTRHPAYGEFVTNKGQELTLRTPGGWKAPAKNTRGTLIWHGDYLDNWSEL